MGNCHTVLVRTLLPVAEKEFTDWQAWTDLLINDDDIEEDLKELACFVLVYVTNVCITNSYKDEFLHDMGSFPALSCNKVSRLGLYIFMWTCRIQLALT